MRATSGMPDNVKIFINFTEELIFQRFPLALPPQNTVIEVLENIPVTPKLVERLRELKAEGYIIALDDFVGDPRGGPLVRTGNSGSLACLFPN